VTIAWAAMGGGRDYLSCGMIFKEKYNDQYGRFTVNLGLDYNFFGFLHTFENAIEVLMDDVADSGVHADRISYPILFLMRHFLELGLKANIRHFSRYSGRTDHIRSKAHELTPLFDAFQLHMEGTMQAAEKFDIPVEKNDTDALQEHIEKMSRFIARMDILDKGSDAFRYPVNKEYEKIFAHDQQVNLVEMIRQLDECSLLLTHTKDAWAPYTAAMDKRTRTD
jgi:hypothetical protein